MLKQSLRRKLSNWVKYSTQYLQRCVAEKKPLSCEYLVDKLKKPIHTQDRLCSYISTAQKVVVYTFASLPPLLRFYPQQDVTFYLNIKMTRQNSIVSLNKFPEFCIVHHARSVGSTT